MKLLHKFTILFLLSFCITLSHNAKMTYDNLTLIGDLVVLNPLPAYAPNDNKDEDEESKDEQKEDDNEDKKKKDDDPLNPRSLVQATIISIDAHTLYLYPDGIHSTMELWVCDTNNNIVEHRIFEMGDERQSLPLPSSLSGEYYVYLKLGNSYYIGNIWL